MFPLVVDLRGRDVLVIGAGQVGVKKAAQLILAGANVRMITDQVLGELPEGIVDLAIRRYETGDLAGSFLVVSATGDPEVNDLIFAESTTEHIWLNVVDDMERSTFFFTAVHRSGDVTVSVSTNGASPALAQWIRNCIRTMLPSNLGEVALTLRSERTALKEAGLSTEDRPWTQRITELVDRRGRAEES